VLDAEVQHSAKGVGRIWPDGPPLAVRGEPDSPVERIRAIVTREFPLKEAETAHRLLRENALVGRGLIQS
jgi:hypothetical protein